MLTFNKGALRGRIRVPGDKSISHRALILSALSTEPIAVRNLNPGRDVYATAQAINAIGRHAGEFHDPETEIDCLNSGSTARMMMGVFAGANLSGTFVGDASLRRRPMEPVAAQLRAFGASVETTDGKLPARVRGTGSPQTRDFILLSPSAQIKSALLFAGVFAGVPVSITGDKSSRDHTERLLQSFGADVEYDRAGVRLRSMPSQFHDVDVPGDFSSAAFFIVAATIAPGSSIVIEDVGINPTRIGLLDALRAMGANVRFERERTSSGEPVADIAVEHAPLAPAALGGDVALRAIDEIPVLAVAAAFARGETRVSGIGDLRTKESDRIAAIERLLHAAAVETETTRDGIIIRGGSPRVGESTVVETRGDHRTAMAAAVLAAGTGALAIDDESSIDVSFPSFSEQLQKAQA